MKFDPVLVSLALLVWSALCFWAGAVYMLMEKEYGTKRHQPQSRRGAVQE